MMNKKLYLQQQLEQPSIIGATASLVLAIISLSLASIFVKLSEQEISPNALVFHRLWIATIIFLDYGINSKQEVRKNLRTEQ